MNTIQEQIKLLADDGKWHGGWYQPIVFPDGSKTFSTKEQNPIFYSRESLGVHKWEKLIKPYLPQSEGTFLEIGCNAGLYLVLAKQAGFNRVIGIDKFEHFYNQCKFVLSQFNIEADIFLNEAMDFDFLRLPTIDVTLMANALYWIVWMAGKEKYVYNPEEKFDDFLKRLAWRTRYLIAIGAESADRLGGKLDLTVPYVDKYFDISTQKIVKVNDRLLNIVVGKSRFIDKMNMAKAGVIKLDPEEVIKIAKIKNTHPENAESFMESFKLFVKGYIAYTDWIKKKIGQSGHYRLCKLPDINDVIAQDAWLIKSIQESGIKNPLVLMARGTNVELDGFHRLVIAKELGIKELPVEDRR